MSTVNTTSRVVCPVCSELATLTVTNESGGNRSSYQVSLLCPNGCAPKQDQMDLLTYASGG
jgi:hypothetical protein